jgi:hypothetical protein
LPDLFILRYTCAMLTDAARAAQSEMQVKDVAEVVAESMA